MPPVPGTDARDGLWLEDPAHRAFLKQDALSQLRFFRAG